LEGWNGARACELTALDSLNSVWVRKAAEEQPASDPTKNLSFNLNLTPSQQQSRAQVPLPYAHDGRPQESQSSGASFGTIFYDPDSADDIDDDDPDEDLDI
jgi:elongator complex protein 5